MRKCCIGCGIEKPADDFYERKGRPGQRQTRCKVCWAARGSNYFQQNRDRLSAAHSEWQTENREKSRAYTREWRKRHPEQAKAGDREQSVKRRAARARRARERFLADPEKHRAAQRRTYARSAATRAAVKRANAVRRARQMAVAIGPIDYAAVLARSGGICHLCGKRVRKSDRSFDHLIPLALGGPHAEWNLGLAHRSCNAKKGARFASPAQMPLL